MIFNLIASSAIAFGIVLATAALSYAANDAQEEFLSCLVRMHDQAPDWQNSYTLKLCECEARTLTPNVLGLITMGFVGPMINDKINAADLACHVKMLCDQDSPSRRNDCG
jgi:hypothetical protein